MSIEKIIPVGAALGGLLGAHNKDEEDEETSTLDAGLRGAGVGGLSGLAAYLGQTYGLKGGMGLGESLSDDHQTQSDIANITGLLAMIASGYLGYKGGKGLLWKKKEEDEEKEASSGMEKSSAAALLGAILGASHSREDEEGPEDERDSRSGALRGAGIGAGTDLGAYLGLLGGRSLGREVSRQLGQSLGLGSGLGGLLGLLGGGYGGYNASKSLLWPKEWSEANEQEERQRAAEYQELLKELGYA